ncbi:MAG: serine/threonine-protein kinase [Candidatus Acidiferrales bacterium]
MGYKRGYVLNSAFDTYTVERQIGAGGSGEVYEVHDSEGTAYAVKILDPARTNRTRLKRFKNEIYFCTKNTHRNLIQVHASGIAGTGATFYVMSLYSGTLRDLMSKRIAPASVLPYFGQILDGVEAAHLQGVWHRDLKPENILFSADTDVLVVADFGIAHFEEEELLTAVETKNNERLANFLYSAPEQKIRGQRVDNKSDIYALGLILNEMFSGAVPQGTSFRSVSESAPEYAFLDGLIELMLRQNGAQRPSVDDVKRELIARGNEFLSVQRLNSLKSEVIPDTEVDDPIIRNPIKIAAADYRQGRLVIKLTRVPPPNWITAFTRPMASWSSYPGSGPQSFNFTGDEASVALHQGMSAKQLLEHTKSYVELANRQYGDKVRAEHQKSLAHEREQHRKEIAEEEQRQKILRELKL